jgi:hypothetical protein
MLLMPVRTPATWKIFFNLPHAIYKRNPAYRHTEAAVARLVVRGPSVFQQQATVLPYLLADKPLAGQPHPANRALDSCTGPERICGRCALILDKRKPDTVQIAFFEALPGLTDPLTLLKREIRSVFPGVKHFTVGLNGHINYSAGLLAANFDAPSCFGLSYTPAYYLDYFKELQVHTLYTYRFPTRPFFELARKKADYASLKGLTVRPFNRKKIKEEVCIYTSLNNACFKEHPFWIPRTEEEDYELFFPFRFFIREGNLLFLEKEGTPIGFFLWYPDFNQLVRPHEELSLKHILHFLIANPITTIRFTQIGILPAYQASDGVLLLILAAIPYVKKAGYTQGEGGFIFAENSRSLRMANRFIYRACGLDAQPAGEYRIYEGQL